MFLSVESGGIKGGTLLASFVFHASKEHLALKLSVHLKSTTLITGLRVEIFLDKKIEIV